MRTDYQAFKMTKDQMEAEINQALAQGEKIVVVTNHKHEGEMFEEKCNFKRFGDKYRFYNSESSDKIKNEECGNPNTYWPQLEVLMYTSSITVGIDFNVIILIECLFMRILVHVLQGMLNKWWVEFVFSNKKYVGICSPESVHEHAPITLHGVKEHLLNRLQYTNKALQAQIENVMGSNKDTNEQNINENIKHSLERKVVFGKLRWGLKRMYGLTCISKWTWKISK